MDKANIDVSALYGFEEGLREGDDELERARELAVMLEGRVAELEAALNDALRLHHYERECHCPECDRIRAALAAGTGDEVGAVVRASVEYMRLCADTRLWYPNDELESAVAALLVKQPAWEVKRCN